MMSMKIEDGLKIIINETRVCVLWRNDIQCTNDTGCFTLLKGILMMFSTHLTPPRAFYMGQKVKFHVCLWNM